jgi:hypothetical protein
MLDLALIVSTIPDRQHLLNRSLHTWKRAAETLSMLSIGIFVHSEGYDATEDMRTILTDSLEWECNSSEISGSHIRGYNHFTAKIEADTYLFSHPEILFPETTMLVAIVASRNNVYAPFKVFWIPEHMTANLNNYPWDRPEYLEHEPHLYQLDLQEKGAYYWNRDTRGKDDWESTTTWAMNRPTLQKLLPFKDFGEWGPDDMHQLSLRKQLGIETRVISNPILFHQWHPHTPHNIESIIEKARL